MERSYYKISYRDTIPCTKKDYEKTIKRFYSITKEVNSSKGEFKLITGIVHALAYQEIDCGFHDIDNDKYVHYTQVLRFVKYKHNQKQKVKSLHK